MLLIQLKTYIRYVLDIIYSTMVPSFMFDAKSVEHRHHSLRTLLSNYFSEVFLNVDIFSQVIFDVESFLLSLLS